MKRLSRVPRKWYPFPLGESAKGRVTRYSYMLDGPEYLLVCLPYCKLCRLQDINPNIIYQAVPEIVERRCGAIAYKQPNAVRIGKYRYSQIRRYRRVTYDT